MSAAIHRSTDELQVERNIITSNITHMKNLIILISIITLASCSKDNSNEQFEALNTEIVQDQPTSTGEGNKDNR